jgi:hypothetical protein
VRLLSPFGGGRQGEEQNAFQPAQGLKPYAKDIAFESQDKRTKTQDVLTTIFLPYFYTISTVFHKAQGLKPCAMDTLFNLITPLIHVSPKGRKEAGQNGLSGKTKALSYRISNLFLRYFNPTSTGPGQVRWLSPFGGGRQGEEQNAFQPAQGLKPCAKDIPIETQDKRTKTQDMLSTVFPPCFNFISTIFQMAQGLKPCAMDIPIETQDKRTKTQDVLTTIFRPYFSPSFIFLPPAGGEKRGWEKLEIWEKRGIATIFQPYFNHISKVTNHQSPTTNHQPPTTDY